MNKKKNYFQSSVTPQKVKSSLFKLEKLTSIYNEWFRVERTMFRTFLLITVYPLKRRDNNKCVNCMAQTTEERKKK